MTREEQRKQAAYSRYAIVSSPVVFKAQSNCFIEGSEWADKTMIGKACEWLEENTGKHIHINTDWNIPEIDYDFFINFRKAMEG